MAGEHFGEFAREFAVDVNGGGKPALPRFWVLLAGAAMLLGSAGSLQWRFATEKKAVLQQYGTTELLLGRFELIRKLGLSAPDNLPRLCHVVEIEVVGVIRGDLSHTIRTERKVQQHQHRIQQAVTEAVRACDPGELSNPDMEPLKRTVRSRVHTVLGPEIIEDVFFSHFRDYIVPEVL